MGDLVDLALERVERGDTPADVVVEVRLSRLADGTVAWSADCQVWAEDGQPVVSDAWIRANLREALLGYARRWRMGLVRRPKRAAREGR